MSMVPVLEILHIFCLILYQINDVSKHNLTLSPSFTLLYLFCLVALQVFFN